LKIAGGFIMPGPDNPDFVVNNQGPGPAAKPDFIVNSLTGATPDFDIHSICQDGDMVIHSVTNQPTVPAGNSVFKVEGITTTPQPSDDDSFVFVESAPPNKGTPAATEDFSVNAITHMKPKPVDFVAFLRGRGVSDKGIHEHLIEIGRPDLAEEMTQSGQLSPQNTEGGVLVRVTSDSLRELLAKRKG
jgi:hypothetical protein